MKSRLSCRVFCSEEMCLKVSQKLSFPFSSIKKYINTVNHQASEVRQIQSVSANKIKDLTHLAIKVRLKREICHMDISPSCAPARVTKEVHVPLKSTALLQLKQCEWLGSKASTPGCPACSCPGEGWQGQLRESVNSVSTYSQGVPVVMQLVGW